MHSHDFTETVQVAGYLTIGYLFTKEVIWPMAKSVVNTLLSYIPKFK